ncbi:endothelial zinc finger protein induced by tumor necrosis factor alpha-like [Schistocerca americana]|uniref:endothelial zinc finger protein induced by tumor necrosis factor alpha-like n=1 Tax=Schistocerca americana TaxID=7009 RepID=UPI001F502905|nr:endothelial zinc finger protein induced by tumor necrosis factor alpha-like [Schistocerca americana]
MRFKKLGIYSSSHVDVDVDALSPRSKKQMLKLHCDVCKKTFSHRSNLKQRSELHTDSIPYICSVCHKRFRTDTILKKHTHVHADDHPWTCACDGACSAKDIEDALVKRACVQKGYGSLGDRAQCLGPEAGLDKHGSTVLRAVTPAAPRLLPSEDSINGFRRKRSVQTFPRQQHPLRCIFLTGEGGSKTGSVAHCVPGTTFMMGCNKCLCRQCGRRAFCTKKDCHKQLSDVCVPGKVTKMECNTCICSAAGRWACTYKECHSGFKCAYHCPIAFS